MGALPVPARDEAELVMTTTTTTTTGGQGQAAAEAAAPGQASQPAVSVSGRVGSKEHDAADASLPPLEYVDEEETGEDLRTRPQILQPQPPPLKPPGPTLTTDEYGVCHSSGSRPGSETDDHQPNALMMVHPERNATSKVPLGAIIAGGSAEMQPSPRDTENDGDNEPSESSRRKSLLNLIFGHSSNEIADTDKHDAATHVRFSPKSVSRCRWDILLIVLIVYTCLELPPRIAFAKDDNVFDVLMGVDLAVDIVFLLDVVLAFETGIEDHGIIEMHRDIVRRTYVRSWFAFDLLSSVPIDFFTYLANVSQSERLVLRLPRLLRLLRLPRLIRYLQRWSNLISIDTSLMRISKLVFFIIIFAHMNACAQYYFARLEGFPPHCWVVRNNLMDASNFVKYSIALFNALSHMLCIGYGRHEGGDDPVSDWLEAGAPPDDPPLILAASPVTTTEVWVTVISMVTGASFYVVLIGVMSSLMLGVDQSGQEYTMKLDVWKQYFSYRQLPRDLRERVLNYYEHRWHTRKIFNEEQLLGQLNSALKTDAHMHNCRNLLDTVPLFSLVPHAVISELVKRLKFHGCLSGELIYCDGQVAEEMYFISSGRVEILHPDGDLITVLGEGSYFGEFPLIFDDIPLRTATARSIGYCDLCILRSYDFHDVATVYPELPNVMREIAEARRRHTARRSAESNSFDY